MNRRNSHSITNLTVHIVFITKYRYRVLTWEIQKRTRNLIRQKCDANDVRIIKWVVSKDHVHLHVEYSPELSISDLVKWLKWYSSRKLRQEYPILKKRYWWWWMWWVWYWAWSTWVVSEDLINNYLEHHRTPSNFDTENNFILE